MQFGNKLNEFDKLHEFDECNLLNEFNLFPNLHVKPFNLIIITWVPCRPCLLLSQQKHDKHIFNNDPFNTFGSELIRLHIKRLFLLFNNLHIKHPCNYIEKLNGLLLVELVQFVNSFNLFPNCTEAHLIFLYN